MRQILSFLLCLCTAFTLSAQTYSGKVTDEKNRPLPYEALASCIFHRLCYYI